MFARDPQFTAAHAEPLPFRFQSKSGAVISFKTPDGGEGKAYAVKCSKPTNRVVFMIHEWWGLNDYIKKEAEQLQNELGDVTVLALDLYDGKVATAQQEAETYMAAAKEERIRSIIQGAIAHAGDKATIGTIGWCFGGGWSLQTSLLTGKQAAACIMYYGLPEKNADILKTLDAPVLGIFAKRDGWITPKIVEEFEKTMKDVSKNLRVESFDADHAFANPSNPNFNRSATDAAHKIAVQFLRKNLIK